MRRQYPRTVASNKTVSPSPVGVPRIKLLSSLVSRAENMRAVRDDRYRSLPQLERLSDAKPAAVQSIQLFDALDGRVVPLGDGPEVVTGSHTIRGDVVTR